MKAGPTAGLVYALLALMLLVGCDRDPPPPTEVRPPPDGRSVEPGFETAEREIEYRIEALDRKIEETEDELSRFGDSVSEEVREEWRELSDERRALATQVEELGSTARVVLLDAVDSLEQKLEGLREELSSSNNSNGHPPE